MMGQVAAALFARADEIRKLAAVLHPGPTSDGPPAEPESDDVQRKRARRVTRAWSAPSRARGRRAGAPRPERIWARPPTSSRVTRHYARIRITDLEHTIPRLN